MIKLKWDDLDTGIAQLVEHADSEELMTRLVNTIEEELGYVWMWELVPLKREDLLAIPHVGEKQVESLQVALHRWATAQCGAAA